MPLKRIPYRNLTSLIKRYLSRREELETRDLIKHLSVVRPRHYLKKSELVEICLWKAPRAIHHIKSNSEDKIIEISRKVFNTKSEKKKVINLTRLSGVSVPMASSILMLTNPQRYGVIDIRVWEVLFQMGSVKTNPKGNNFNFKEWYRYLMIIRHFANKFRVKARDIERTLFKVHKKYQKGRLYENL